jgi:aminoglycoside 2'-N-acetyltransferase I
MAVVRVAHSAMLSPDDLRAIRALLDESFDDLTDDDYEHALGGMHALVRDGTELIGHGSVILRLVPHGGRSLQPGTWKASRCAPTVAGRSRRGVDGRAGRVVAVCAARRG